MFGAIKRSWHKAQALSALQTAYDQPLREPLAADVETDLQAVMRLVVDAGGTPYDTATSYMILRLDAAIREGRSVGAEFGSALGRHWALRDQHRLHDQHTAGFGRLGDSLKGRSS